MSAKRRRSSEDEAPRPEDNICISAAIEDRDSKFIAYYSPSIKPKTLQQLPEIASASHKMLGWRRESNQQSITKATQYVTGSDDDGEKYGGKRIEKVLESCKVTGACVVARWYGGTMLGPVRFTHIEECAREAILKSQARQLEQQQKKVKLDQDAQELQNLIKALPERDQHIVVLRKLAADKEASLKVALQKTESSPSEAAPTSSPRPAATTPLSVDYSKMPIERLRTLDKARDATISFLLNRIDKAEAELAAIDTASDASPGKS